MKHIYEINKAVEELRRRTPNHEFFAVLRVYKDKGKIDSYLALDRIGSEIGIKAHCWYDTRLEPGGWEAPGWVGYVGYEGGNQLTHVEDESDLRWFPEGQALECQVYAAKKQVRAMMKVPNLAEHVFAKFEYTL